MPNRIRCLVEVPEKESKRFEDVFLSQDYIEKVSLKKKIGIFIYILKFSPMDLSKFCRKMAILKNGGSDIDYRILPF